MMTISARYVRKRKNSPNWIYFRRVPEFVAHLDGRRFVKKSTKTTDFAEACIIAKNINIETEAYWQALLETGQQPDTLKRYHMAVERARLIGVTYKPIDELVLGDVEDIIDRLGRLESGRLLNSGSAVSAVLGGEELPNLLFSNMLDTYFDLTRDRLFKKAPDQVRKWKNPRIKAVRNLINLLGDKSVVQVTRDDALDFRTWWLDRVLEEGYDPGTANKDIGNINQIINEIDDKYRLGLSRPFAGMRLKGETHNKRVAYEVQFVANHILRDGALDALNEEARLVVYVMVGTGMRPSEIVNLQSEDIFLKSEVPYVSIVARNREVKTLDSVRHMPLVGVALAAMRKAPDGFPRYRENADSLSAIVNQVLLSSDLRPTREHTLYSLRHTFQDRLTAVEVPDRLQAELMGHKFDRPKYGQGPSLKQKARWLERVSYPPPNSLNAT